jgi:RNA polymerase sigma-70 factor (ECF subfamily)
MKGAPGLTETAEGRTASEPAASAGAPARPAGDEDLAQAFSEHRSYLRRYLARRAPTPQDAEDLSQEVYLRALGFARREKKVDNWRGILTRIAADLVVDGFRRQQARAGDRHTPIDLLPDLCDNGVNSPERILQGREKIVQVERTLEALDPDCRRAFLLVRFHGYSYAEVAAELKLDTIAVGRLIERATLRLAKAAISDQ